MSDTFEVAKKRVMRCEKHGEHEATMVITLGRPDYDGCYCLLCWADLLKREGGKMTVSDAPSK